MSRILLAGAGDGGGQSAYLPTLSPVINFDSRLTQAKIYTDTGFTTLVTTNGDNIKGWKDQGSRAANVTESTNPPTYKSSDDSARFNGTNQLLTYSGTGFSINPSSQPYTAFFVFRVDSVSVTSPIMSFDFAAHEWGVSSSGHFYLLRTGVGTDFTGTATLSANTTYVYTLRHDGGSAINGRILGASDGTANSFSTSNVGMFKIGKQYNNATYFGGDINKIFIVQSTLSDANCALAEAELRTIFGAL